MTRRTRTIQVEALARVEGEGALLVRVEKGRVVDVKLRIYEPPRFFEALLRGRRLEEAPDITARICGICPVAYQMSAVGALEAALGLVIPPSLQDLRRLLYCGEWISSHVLHVAMLHAPDFLGYPSAIEMARDHPGPVNLALGLKKLGNAVVTAVGGREIHPVSVRVGGFHRVPTRAALAALRPALERAVEEARALVRWGAGFDYPEFEPPHDIVALRTADRYPMETGRVAIRPAGEGAELDVDAGTFLELQREEHEPHSNALHSVLRGRGAYLVGPLARYSLNADRLTPAARDAAAEAGLGPTCANPFRSLLVRAVETVLACEEAVRLIGAYEPPDPPFVPWEPRPGIGTAATEAPRGMLVHRYEIGADGCLVSARIVPPTAQNLKAIETDLWALVPPLLDQPDDVVRGRCEQAIRNHDPCISCATHFLKLDLQRSGSRPAGAGR